MNKSLQRFTGRRAPTVSKRKLPLAIAAITQMLVSGAVIAGPEGGVVVGGKGSIQQSGRSTTINQATDRLAIDWQSFDVAADERVTFHQPTSSSISLNRILSNRGSEIHGRIDANGHVVLVNPNGVFFSETATINAGGLLASGLNIRSEDFMNGDFAFSALEGTDGTVINAGIINAATGGSVTLLGKKVENSGMITANLGAVNLAAGKEAIVTFDNEGLLGVRVTEGLLQEEIGVDPAVLNSGDINAQGGRILISGSASQDLFSRAVNAGDLNQEVSVVMHDDGSFTLGAGADVVNTGNLNVSANNTDAGRVIVVGENVTSTGEIRADSAQGSGGQIELHATDKTELKELAVVSANSSYEGEGGNVKVLGNKVGLFDEANVSASGANGGGTVLIGGDKTGANNLVRNAEFIYLGEETHVSADALDNGDGGKVITFASNTARIYGGLSARGGVQGGNGGFIETSGLRSFEIWNAPNVNSVDGGGEWLIDPYDVEITWREDRRWDNNSNVYTPNDDTARVNIDTLRTAFINNTGINITITTGGDGSDGSEAGNIIFRTDFDYNGIGTGDTLTLTAYNNIETGSYKIYDSNTSVTSTDNLSLNFSTSNGAIYIGPTSPSSAVNGGACITAYTGGCIDTNGGSIVLNSNNNSGGWTSDDGDIEVSVNIYTDGGDATFIADDSFYHWRTSNSIIDITGGHLDIRATDISGGDSSINPDIVLGRTNAGQLTLTSGEAIRGWSTLSTSTPVTDANFHINVTGTTTITAKEKYVDLRNTSNSFAGNISIDTSQTYGVSGNVDLYGTNIQLGDINTSNDSGNAGVIDVRASGTLTSNGTINASTLSGNAGQVDLSGADVVVNGTINTSAVSGNAAQINVDVSNSFTGNSLLDASADTGGGGSDAAISITGDASNNTFSIGSGFSWAGSGLTLDGGSNTASSAGDTLIYTGSANNTWLIDGSNQLTIDYDNAADAIAPIVINFSNIESLTGGTGNDSFTFDGATVSGLIDGTSGADDTFTITDITADSTVQIGSEINTNINVINVDSIVNNDADNTHSLYVATGNNSWSINNSVGDGTNDGSVSSAAIDPDGTPASGDEIAAAFDGTVNFENFSVLVGGAHTDSFTIDVAYAGNINAGAGDDTFNINAASTGTLSGEDDNDSFILGAAGTATLLEGGAGTADSITAKEQDTDWNITGENAGNLELSPNTGTFYVDSFTGVEVLNGTDAYDDTFIFSSNTALNSIGQINAGESLSDNDAIDLSGLAEAIQLTLADDGSVLGFANIETVVGIHDGDGGATDYNSTLIFNSSSAVAWQIANNGDGRYDGINDGSVNGVNFINFNNLTGSDTADTFTFNGGVVTGDVRGAAIAATETGSDTIIVNSIATDAIAWTLSGANQGDIVLTPDGGSAQNILGTFYSIDTLTGGDGTDTLTGRNQANTWTINSAGNSVAGTVDSSDSVSFSGMETLVGNVLEDIFNIADSIANIFGGEGADTFNIQANNITTTVVGGEEGTDTSIDVINGNNATTAWNLSGGESGQIDLGSANYAVADITFSDVESVVGGTSSDYFFVEGAITLTADGGAGDDTFSIADAGSVGVGAELRGGLGSDTLQGRAGTNTNWVLVSLNSGELTDQAATPSSYVSSFTGFDKYIGRAPSNILNGLDEASTWTIDTTSTLALTAAPTITVEFSGMDVLSGGNLADIFNINTGFSGQILGNAGDDDFNISAIVSSALQGGDGADEFYLLANNITATIDGGSDASTDIVYGHNSETSWNLTGGEGGQIDLGSANYAVADVTFTEIESAQGGAGIDHFDITGAASLSLSGNAGADIFTITSDASSVISGGADADTFNIGGNVSGTISGDAGADIFEINTTTSGSLDGGANDDVFNVNVAGVTANVVGGTESDRLTLVYSDNATWTFDGLDGNETVTDQSATPGTISFAGVEVALGSDTGQDTFNVTSVLSGITTFQGRGGNDTFNLGVAGATITAQGGAGDDQFNIADAGVSGSVDGGTENDTLTITHGGAPTWTINSSTQQVVHGTGTITFDGAIENLEGSNTGVDTFNISNTYSGNITGRGANDIFNLTAQVLGDLLGGAGSDIFNINAANFSQILDGGSGTDTVAIGHNTATTWTIDGADGSETVTNGSGTITFISGNTLQGSDSGVDRFNVTAAFSGSIEGRGGNDIFSLGGDVSGGVAGGDGADDFNISANQTGSLDGGLGQDDFNILAENIGATIVGGSDASGDILSFETLTNVLGWTINGEPEEVTNGTGTVVFSEIEEAKSGSGNDTFTITSDFAGVLFGGGGNDTADYSGRSGAFDIVLGAGFSNALQEFEIITGNNNVGTALVREAGTSATWDVSGVNSGTINIVGSTAFPDPITFSGFGSLTGGSGNDTFNITGALGEITGSISGGNTGTDVIQMQRDFATTWTVNAGNTGEFVYGTATTQFSSIERLVGYADQVDTFAITSTSVTVQVDGLNGTGIVDILDLSGIGDALDITLGTDPAGISAMNIERIEGNGHVDSVLTGADVVNVWTIDGTNSGSVLSNGVTTEFGGFRNITGGSNNDDFNLENTGIIQGTISGGTGGTDTIYGRDTATTWSITNGGSNTLSASGVTYVGNFTNIDILQGGTADDLFTLGAGASYIGSIQGGAGTGSDTLTVTDGTNNWELNPSTSTGVLNTNTLFSEIEIVNGGSGQDTFVFVTAGNFGTSVDAGGNTDTVDISGIPNYSAVLGTTTINGVTNAEQIIGGSTSSLTGLNSGTNTWRIYDFDGVGGVDGLNDGELENGGTSIRFINFTNLIGGNSAIDNFTITSTGAYSGVLNGGTDTANNSLTNLHANGGWQLTSAFGGSLTANGRTSTYLNIQNIHGSGSDSLTGLNQINDWQVTNANTGTVGLSGDVAQHIAFSGMSNLFGNVDQDIFTLSASGSITGDIRGTLAGQADNNNDFLYVNSTASALIDWTVSGNNSGTVTPIGGSFIGIENLIGGAGLDTFAINANITGVIRGEGGNDTFNVNNAALSLSIDGGAATIGDILTLGYSEASNWSITDALQTATSATSNGVITFAGIENAEGTAQKDVFDINGGGVTGITSGNGDDEFFIRSANQTLSIDAGTGVDSDRLEIAYADNTTWLINGSGYETATADVGTGVVSFTGIDAIDASVQKDTVTISGGSVDIIRGRAGSDDFNVDAALVLEIDAGAGETDTLTINHTQATTWVLDGGDETAVASGNTLTFNSIETITSSNAADTVTFNAPSGSGVEVTTFSSRNGDDSFTVNDAGLSITLNAGSQNNVDTLILGYSEASNWSITNALQTATSATSNGVITFAGIENAEGTAQKDVFDINGGGVTGITSGNGDDEFIIRSANQTLSIDAGTGVDSDRLEIAYADNTTWLINGSGYETATADVGTGVVSFTGIDAIDASEQKDTVTISGGTVDIIRGRTGSDDFNVDAALVLEIDAGAGETDTLTVNHTQATTWVLDGGNETAVANGNTLTFNSIETITSSNAADTVTFNAPSGSGVEVTTFSSRNGDDSFTVNDAGLSITLNAGSQNNVDTLILGYSEASNWSITNALQTATSATSNGVITFAGIENAEGTAQKDVFDINGGGVTGITSGNGDDEFIIRSANQTLSIDAGTGVDSDRLEIAYADNTTWLINGSGYETATADVGTGVVSFTGIDAIDASVQKDTVTISGGSVDIIRGRAGSDDFNVDAALALEIDAGAGETDTLTVNHTQATTWVLDGDNETAVANGNTLTFNSIESITSSNAADTVTINVPSGGAVEVTEFSSRNGDDRFTINDSNLNLTIDAGSQNAFDSLDLGYTENATWELNGGSETVTSSTGGEITFSNFENYLGSGGTDNFTIATNVSRNIEGQAGDDRFTFTTAGSVGGQLIGGAGDDTLIGDNNNNSYTISGTNSGTASGISIGFTEIENITAGSGRDTFTFTDINASISGLLDGGESSATGSSEVRDTLNVEVFTNGVVVEIGEPIFSGSLVSGTSSLPNVNVTNFEVIDAAAGTGAEEANNWLAIAHSGAVEWRITNAPNNGFVQTLDNIADKNPVTNEITRFTNFGSFDGARSSGEESNLETEGNITGEWRRGSGLIALDFSDATGFVIVDITDRVQSVLGNNDTLLRITSDTAEFNIDNTWTIDGENSGSFIVNSGDQAGFTFTFTDVNQFEGGSGRDAFVFLADGRLTNGDLANPISAGAINGGLGINTVTADLAINNLSFGLNQTDLRRVTDGFPISLRGQDVEVLLDREGIIDLTNVEQLTGSSVANVDTTLFSGSADTSYVWNIARPVNGLPTNTLDGNGDSLTFTGVDFIRGGEASDTFNIYDLLAVNANYDGGAGTGVDVLNLQNITQDIQLSLDSALAATVDVVATNMSQIQASQNFVNTLIAEGSQNNNWIINGTNSGTLNGMTFSHFANLTGAGTDDYFALNGDDAITGKIDGGSAGFDTLDISSLNGDTIISFDPSVASTFNITNIDSLMGNVNTNNTLIGSTAHTSWTISDLNSGSLSGVLFTNFGNLIGSTAVDIFTINGLGRISGLIDGGITGANTLDFTAATQDIDVSLDPNITQNIEINIVNVSTIRGNATRTNSLYAGGSGPNTWNVVNENAGDLNGIAFSGMSNLIGSDLVNDSFIFGVNGDVTGLINGGTNANAGTPNSDSLNLSAKNQGIVVELGSDTTSENLHVVNIESITAADTAALATGVTEDANRLISNRTGNYNWIITSENDGRIEPDANVTEENTIVFENFGYLDGGSGDDNFRFETTGHITGAITGGLGTDRLDLSIVERNIEFTVGDVIDLGANGTSISGLEGLIGNNDGSSATGYNAVLNVASGDSTWTIQQDTGNALSDGINDGTYDNGSGGAPEMSFINFNQIQSGSGNDTFRFVGVGRLTGGLDGGTGTNRILSAGSTISLTVNLGAEVFDQINASNVSEIVLGNASGLSNRLVADNIENTWVINGTDAGTLNSVIDFENIQNLIGGTNVDRFELDGNDSISGLMDGGLGSLDHLDISGIASGRNLVVELGTNVSSNLNVNGVETIQANLGNENTLVADNSNNTWKIDGDRSGTLAPTVGATPESSIAFSGFSSLTGGTGDDQFTITATGNIPGMIDGGEGNDSLDITAFTTDSYIVVGNSIDGTLNINRLENIDANSANTVTNTLRADDIVNSWIIDSANAGSLNGMAFSGFANLEGGDNNDRFGFTDAGSLTGYLDGGSQTVDGQDILDLSQQSVVNIVLGGGLNNVRDIELLLGNNTNSTLTATDSVNIWDILSGENSGSINGSVFFEGFNHLVGGSAQDTFNLAGGDVTGNIYGRNGNDIFNISNGSSVGGVIYGEIGNDIVNATILGGTAAVITFDGGSDINTLNTALVIPTGSTVSYNSVDYSLTAQGSERLLYQADNAAQSSIVFTNVNTVNENVDSTLLNIQTTGSGDLLTLRDNQFVLNSNNITYSTVNFANKDSVRISAGANDEVALDGVINIDSQLTIKGASISVTNSNARINAGELVLDQTGAIGSDTSRLVIDVDRLNVTNAGSAIYLAEQNDIEISGLNSRDIFDLEAVGNIQSGQNLTSTGTLTLEAGGNINLTGSGNRFDGDINLVAGGAGLNPALGSINLVNSSSTILNSISARELSVRSSGDILTSTSGGAIRVFENAQFTALNGAVGQRIELTNNSNDFMGEFRISNGSGGLGASQVTLHDGNGLNIVEAVVGDLSINNLAGVLQTSGVVASGGVNIVTEDMTVANGVAGNGISASTININASGRFVQDGGLLATGSDSITNALVINANQYESLTGPDIFSRTTNGSIDILVENDITTQTLDSAGNITITSNTGDVSLGQALTVADSLIINANQGIRLSEDVVVENDANFTAGAGGFTQNANLVSTRGDIYVDSAAGINMATGATTTAMAGSITYEADGSINLYSLVSGQSASSITIPDAANIVLRSGGGISGTTGVVALSADYVQMTAESGIGNTAGGLDLSVGTLSAVNNTGAVSLTNDKEIHVERIHNNGNIQLSVSDGDIVIGSSTNVPYLTGAYAGDDPASLDARLGQGTINANYEIGDVLLTTTGSIRFFGSAGWANPEVIAKTAVFNAPLGEFGQLGRIMWLYVKDYLEIRSRLSNVYRWSFSVPPADWEDFSPAQRSLSDILNTAADQLVEVETLEEVDPAVFTNVRNYFYDDVSIKMPRDQLFDDELDDGTEL
ncbi:filamentous hemagglutinin N-terminal domain-containing protein [Teredinibacter sp. KSP-S5-2]|uniref:filamentous hemagglutinin N-terminal domain-containing protein n=1 Tax=Teredinibacter sp. KSP-S5-2 TaxID=3034506 RepID=UPI0029352C1A|nr:filamentous hemagglutinin N-terminal domain-containing protein [Teredinibacter sp. KSP-S5-2]WNO08042.1 filamentous hemagglutinin N-terminal domain-containing protein [Teredinibacter sp. KSP-S5-2]